MRKVRLPRIPLFSILSLMLLTAVIVFWVRSRHHADVLVFFSPSGHYTGLASDRQGVGAYLSDIPAGKELAFATKVASLEPAEYQAMFHDTVFDPSNIHRKIFGFKTATGTIAPYSWNYSGAIIPYWALLIVFVILPARVFPKIYTRWQRKRRGQCLKCGYDLRHSPGRCPECGTVPEGITVAESSDPATDPPPTTGVVASLIPWLLVGVVIAAGFQSFARGRRAAQGGLGASVKGGPIATAQPVVLSYAIDDLLDKYAPPVDPEETNCLFGPGPYVQTPPRTVAANDLVDVFSKIAADEIPDSVGGTMSASSSPPAPAAPLGPLNVTGDRLLVYETPQGHAQVRTVLAAMRCDNPEGGPTTTATDLLDSHTDLSQTIKDLNLKSATFESATDKLRDLTHSNIVVYWDDLANVDVKRDTPVKLQLWDVTLEESLNVLTSLYGKSTVAYDVRDSVIRIATADRLNSPENTSTRLYDVRDIIEKMMIWERDHSPPDPTTQPGAQPTQGGPANNIFGGSGTYPMSINEATQSISNALMNTVEPDTWKDNGGTLGSIHDIAGRLIIMQTPKNHRKIVDFLRALRADGAKEGLELLKK